MAGLSVKFKHIKISWFNGKITGEYIYIYSFSFFHIEENIN